MADLFARHRATLEKALEASRTRGYWSPHPEIPSGKIYGENAKAEADAAFAALRGALFPLGQESRGEPCGEEVSPWTGEALGIRYPRADVEALVAAAERARGGWARAPIATRVGIALEILARLNRQSFLIANAVQHTTGQSFVMAFQAGGPHAQDRGLEAVALAYEAMTRFPARALWEKPQGKASLRLAKEWRVVPRGIGLVIGCSTFPTWNGYPGLFASLVTGNAVIVKPHPGAVLPLALSVKTAREVLREEGFDPDVVQLAVDTSAAPITKELALHPRIGIVDFTGSPAFGRWLRENLGDKLLFTEEAGVNPVVLQGVRDLSATCANLAFSLSLYSGQMCTAPQNIFVPETVASPHGPLGFEEVVRALVAAIDELLADPARASAVLGTIQSPATLERIARARALGRVRRESAPLPDAHPARTATPLLVELAAENEPAYCSEWFGPIAFLVRCRDAEEALARAAATAAAKGAITAALWATDEDFVARASDAFAFAGAPLSVNLEGQVWVNQAAAFSDFHVSGLNPAGNATFVDLAFVASRFRLCGIRRLAH
ncbi:MAG: phenylacetic acid degradation protein PaaN [Geminicoccaceae bacterium]|nr:phenylacetic acid degradation protein PaaN [Geminicoccaceae bacterium]MCS7268853.1 phenylacetic acid degradation protein PaaN [Geminicoccaceae bacterium]MCX7630378.1 phenylacetic acid degradation protein PaaN [Geminicoccaceae bacterium]MDW8341017.1 phenylacetic acid degradation protein PaaN [Geminicoccaceae bacterium]